MNNNYSYINSNTNQDLKKEIKEMKKIENLYENRTFFSEYGFSVFIFIFITVFVVLGSGFFYFLSYLKTIQDDWNNYRCNPYVIPFAGLINKPDDMSISDYTQYNFDYCNQTILQNTAGETLEPLNYITQVMTNITGNIENSVQNTRSMFNQTRNNMQTVTTEIMQRLLNIVSPLQNLLLDFKDANSRIEGIMSSTLYTTFGIFNIFQTMMASYVNILRNNLLLLKNRNPNSDSNISDLMKNPQPHCFDEDTLLEMNEEGVFKKIKEIEVGDLLKNNNRVTAKLKLKKNTMKMYNLNGVIVSDSHMIFSKYTKEWMYISHYPYAKLVDLYEKPFLYCLNTENKRIIIKNMIFLDWDEIIHLENEKIKSVFEKLKMPLIEKNIHRYLEGGFINTSQINLKGGDSKTIENIEIDDILENGEKVIGLVEIDGSNLGDQYVYKIKEQTIEGGPNIVLNDDQNVLSTLFIKNNNDFIVKSKREKKENKLYHLLTDKLTFTVNRISTYGYNSCIDFLMES